MDLRIEQVAGLRYLRVMPDRTKLGRYRLAIVDVNQVTETIALGHSAGFALEGERRFGLVVKSDHAYAGDLEALRALPLRSVGVIVSVSFARQLEPARLAKRRRARGSRAADGLGATRLEGQRPSGTWSVVEECGRSAGLGGGSDAARIRPLAAST